MLMGNARNTFKSNACHYPRSPIAGTLSEGAQPGIIVWIPAIHLNHEAMIGLSALALRRSLKAAIRSLRFHKQATRGPDAITISADPCSQCAGDAPTVGSCGLRSAP